MAGYSIVDIGKELEKHGLRVGENPAFGSGKVGKHAPGSYHYAGQAIDVTDWRPDVAPAFAGGKPIPWKQRTGELSYRAKKSGLFTEALGPGDRGHDTHVHLALKDRVQATPQLLEWIATGRTKDVTGKLTDVMPGAAPVAQPQQKPVATPAQSTDFQPITIIDLRGKKKEPKDFLTSYRDQLMANALGLGTESSSGSSLMDPMKMAMSVMNQQPINYFG